MGIDNRRRAEMTPLRCCPGWKASEQIESVAPYLQKADPSVVDSRSRFREQEITARSARELEGSLRAGGQDRLRLEPCREERDDRYKKGWCS